MAGFLQTRGNQKGCREGEAGREREEEGGREGEGGRYQIVTTRSVYCAPTYTILPPTPLVRQTAPRTIKRLELILEAVRLLTVGGRLQEQSEEKEDGPRW